MRILLSVLLLILLLPTHAFAEGDCEPTLHRTTGTHYKPVTVEKVNVSTGITVKGQILDWDCQPIPNAKISHWQGGESGRYEDRLYAYMYADAEGKYEFESEWPNLPTPHIHFIIEADGYDVLETQWRGRERLEVIEFNMVLTPAN